MKYALTTGLLLFSLAVGRAEVKPNALFADNMVLQQGIPVPFWGAAKEGEKVTVECAGQSVSATAKDGKWMVRLQPLKAGGGPLTVVIKGENVITLTNVLVGEVWLCSGQSNMERQLGPRPPQKLIDNWEQEVAAANYPQIRHFLVGRKSAEQPLTELSGRWDVCSPQTVANFTAVGYFFGRDLHQALKMPIGLIHSSVGGTPAEFWTSRAALEANPQLRIVVEEYNRAVAEYPSRLQQFKTNETQLVAKYNAAVEQAKKQGKPVPGKPSAPRPPSPPSGLYNGMIAPLEPFALRGVIWYQGESNAGRAGQYRSLFSTMIADWRRAWCQGDFPFLFVQIAPYRGMNPEIREAQLQTWQTTPNTAMAVITDCGDANDIHPTRKQPVGGRLALAARALAYGERLEYSGPVFECMQVEDNRAVVSFKHTGSGLMAKDGVLKGFTIAGADSKFVPAKAEIIGDTVVVTSEEVAKPAAVRYGWSNVPEVNLFNKEGLPASPFRTDAPAAGPASR